MFLVLSLLGAVSMAAVPVDPSVLDKALEETASARAQRRLAQPNITSEHYARVAKGELVYGLDKVEGSGARRAWGVGVVKAPADKVWAAVNDFGLRTDLTKATYAEVQTGTHCVSGRTLFQYMPVGIPMVSDRWWVTRLTSTAAVERASAGRVRELDARTLDPGNAVVTEKARSLAEQGVPIAFSIGGWYLTALDDQHTLVEFSLWTDPGGSVSASLTSAFATGGIQDNFAALDKLLAGGPNCPYASSGGR